MKRKSERRGPGGRHQSTPTRKVINSNYESTPIKLPAALSQLRIASGGPENLSDLDLMEIVLSLALPERDIKDIAFTLLFHFGTFAKAVSAPNEELKRIKGLTADGIAVLRLVSMTVSSLLKADFKDRPVVNNLKSLIPYLTVKFAHDPKEKVHCLFLDSRNRLIADQLVAEGTVNALHIYPREVIKKALDLHATAIILVHNHPSSAPTPTRVDVLATRGIKDAAENLGIELHDSIIIAGTEWFSFREDNTLWNSTE